MTRAATIASMLFAGACGAMLVSGCGRSGPVPADGSRGRVTVVAAENVWGNIAAQLGGARARVQSIIRSPDTDPHGYEPNAGDARALAGAQLVIVNGAGYDRWATRLLRASPAPGRVVLDIAQTLGVGEGDNPHLWYSPAAVLSAAGAIASAYTRAYPSEAAYFEARKRGFLTRGLARYERLLDELRGCCAGFPVGYSESVFQPLGESLGLRLLTPYSFTKAIAEGTDVTAQDKRTVDAQLAGRKVKAWIFNSQNLTPDVQRLNALARVHAIPVVTVSETLTPAHASFQDWQSTQLEALLGALRAPSPR
jgi:zinc/manganese transport system substrate-binding protein